MKTYLEPKGKKHCPNREYHFWGGTPVQCFSGKTRRTTAHYGVSPKNKERPQISFWGFRLGVDCYGKEHSKMNNLDLPNPTFSMKLGVSVGNNFEKRKTQEGTGSKPFTLNGLIKPPPTPRKLGFASRSCARSNRPRRVSTSISPALPSVVSAPKQKEQKQKKRKTKRKRRNNTGSPNPKRRTWPWAFQNPNRVIRPVNNQSNHYIGSLTWANSPIPTKNGIRSKTVLTAISLSSSENERSGTTCAPLALGGTLQAADGPLVPRVDRSANVNRQSHHCWS